MSVMSVRKRLYRGLKPDLVELGFVGCAKRR